MGFFSVTFVLTWQVLIIKLFVHTYSWFDCEAAMQKYQRHKIWWGRKKQWCIVNMTMLILWQSENFFHAVRLIAKAYNKTTRATKRLVYIRHMTYMWHTESHRQSLFTVVENVCLSDISTRKFRTEINDPQKNIQIPWTINLNSAEINIE